MDELLTDQPSTGWADGVQCLGDPFMVIKLKKIKMITEMTF